MSGGSIARLGYKVERSQRQRFECCACAFGRQCAYHDHWNAKPPRDLAQSFQAIHARHFQIQRYNVRTKVFNLLKPKSAVHCRSYNFDFAVPGKDLWNQLSHQCRIIHHQDSQFATHAVAPTICNLPSFATTLERFRISTTVPSPRMEAPLTRSVATR